MSNFYWLNKESREFLSRGYLKDGQTPEERIRQIGETAERILNKPGYADKFYDYMSRGWYSLSTPVWVNFGNERGLPISCFNSYIDDTLESIMYTNAEVGMMSKYGGGTSGYFGDLRPRGSSISVGGQSTGAVHFMQLFETTINVVSQSNIRRGSFAAYYPVEGKDIKEFLEIREEGNLIQNLSIGVTITDKWMKDLEKGKSKNVEIWETILQKKCESGFPYLFFTDTVNNNAPQVYKDKGKKIRASNLCTEICESTDVDESFVCCLSSINLKHWDEIKECPDAIDVIYLLLDAVTTEFIEKTKNMPFMDRAHRFAKNQRALGLGVLGYHSLLQSKMIPFESMQAKFLNTSIFKKLQEETTRCNKELALEYGEPELLKGYGLRNALTTALAPTTSSSFILGQVSPSIEPENSNYYVKDLAKGKYSIKNPYLVKLLEEKGQNTASVWSSILSNGGSVQHLTCLDEFEKSVFKTFGEISQLEIIQQAAARQKFIDQSQSLNLMIDSNTNDEDFAEQLNELYMEAWRLGIKTLYYQRGANPSQKLARNLLNCVSCEG